MRKITLLLLSLVFTAIAYASPGTDTWGYSSQGMSLSDYNSGTVVDTQSGAEYTYSQLWGWFCCYMKPGDNAIVTVSKSAGNVRSIYREGGLGDTFIAVYGSDQPITLDNVASATLIGQLPAADKLDISGDYPYVALVNDSQAEVYFDSLSFTWEEAQEPVPPVETVTDTWGYSSQNMTLSDYNSGTVVDTQSGAEYTYSNLWGWFCCYMKPGDNAIVTVSKSAGNVRSIYREGGLGDTFIAVYGSDQPITLDNVASATLIGQLPAADKLDISGDYPYVALVNDSQAEVYFDSLSFTWEEAQEPVPPVETVTDTWGYSSENMSLQQLNSGTVVDTMSGAEYTYSNLWGWFCCYMRPADNAFITVSKSAGNVRSIARESGLGDTFIAVYGSDQPITLDNVASATLIGQLPAAGTLDISGDYAYVALKNDSDGEVYFDSLSFTWEKAQVNPPVTSDIDHISTANIMEQNPSGNYTASSYTDYSAVNQPMDYTGATGAAYHLDQIISNGTWWTVGWDYPSPIGYVSTTSCDRYIKSVKFDMDWTPQSLEFKVSDKPITEENKYDAKSVTLVKENDALPEWTADGLYKYFYFGQQERVLDITIEYTDEAPVITAATPEINCWASRIVAGTTVYVSTPTENATLNVDVYVNGERHTGEGDDATSAVHNGSNYSFRLPGKTGDIVKVEAYTSKEGYLDSEVARKEFTLEEPQALQPGIEEYPQYVLPGQELTIYSETENATISYTYGLIDYDDNSNNWTSEKLSGASPVKITVPATAKEGLTFFIEATADAEGYAESDMFSLYTQVKSTTLKAPTFSVASGSELIAGAKVTLTRSDNATTIHYTINGGAEQTSAEYSVEIAVNEDMTIEAWVSGNAPYVDSEKVTASYTIEKLNANTDAITPMTFVTTAEYNYDYAKYTGKGENTGFGYSYDGGMALRDEVPCFFLDSSDDQGNKSILYNTDGRTIQRVKLNAGTSWSGCYIMFANEPITSVTEEMKDYDYIKGRLRIINNDERADYGFDEWIDLSKLESDFQNCKYFAVWGFGQNSYVSRVVIEYENEPVGIEGVEGHEGDCRMFDINGIEVNPDSKLAPGIYVRVSGGKASKIAVK